MIGRSLPPGIDDLEIPAFLDNGDAEALDRWKQEHPDWFLAGSWTPAPPRRNASMIEARGGFPSTGQLPGELSGRTDVTPLDPSSLSLADFRQVAEAARRGNPMRPDATQVQYRGSGRGVLRFPGPPRTPSEEAREYRFYDALRTLRKLEPRNPETNILRDPARTPSENTVRTLEQEARDAVLRNANRAAPSGPGEPDPATPYQRELLRREMIREGFVDPDERFEAHHITPGGGEMSGGRNPARSQGILRSFNIDLDSATNGVALSPEFHRRLHTKEYYDYVERGLRAAGSRNQAIAFLRTLARRLKDEDARFQQDKKMPTWEE